MKQFFLVYILLALCGCTSHEQRITAVIDTSDSVKIRVYYRLADGRKVGKDSLYMMDGQTDCESEHKIRFYDRITDKVGFFDSYGKVAIPAVYDIATPFRNGVAIAVANAKRKGWDGEDCTKGDCEHWSWMGGHTMLINERNEVLIDSLHFNSSATPNWYSLRISDSRPDSMLYYSFRGRNGKWYAIMDYEKEFTQWFYHGYLPEIVKPNGLLAHCYDELMNWMPDSEEWKAIKAKDFVARFDTELRLRLREIEKSAVEAVVSPEQLNMFIYTGKAFSSFYDECGEPRGAKYPVFEVVTTYPAGNKHAGNQEHFSFLRTEQGYKLIGVSWIRR